MERLEDAGYEQYEISNVAAPGRRSRHNLKYWTDGEWLGFGCGAHSTRGRRPLEEVSATEDYIDRVGRGASPAVDVRRLSPDERLGDALFTGLRLVDGIDLNAIDRPLRRRRLGAVTAPTCSRSSRPAACGTRATRLRLTRQGMLLAHEVMTVFV